MLSIIGKRGSELPYFVLINVLLALMVIGALWYYVSQIGNDSLFEQNFMARDAALVLDSIYASPGDVSFVYDTSFNKKDRFGITFDDSKVSVFESRQYLMISKPSTYLFAQNKNLPLTTPEQKVIENEANMQIQISQTKKDVLFQKTNNEIKIILIEPIENETQIK